MNKRLISVAIAIMITLTACATPIPSESPDVAPSSEVPAQTPPAPPEASHPPWQDSIKYTPPSVPEEEIKYLGTPCLVKLESYLDGSYTDGVNTFLFEDDGTVLWNNSTGGTLGLGRVHTFEKKEIEKPLDRAALMATDEYKTLCETSSERLGFDYSVNFYIAHKDGGTWYMYYEYPAGGGSGESYWIDDRTEFFKISLDGEFADFGTLKAAHIVWYDEYFYYVELQSKVYATPGIGRVMRVDTNGENRETIISEPVYGTIQLLNNRLYYTSLADGYAYSVNLSGGDKTKISETLVPRYHRIALEFYGDVIISKYWDNSGYNYTHITTPTGHTRPAIMDINERNMVTFPPELFDEGAYEVINWGGEDYYYDEYGSGRMGMYFLFLRSKLDGSYWAYEKFGFYNDSPAAFDWAREQWAEKAG